MIELRTFLRVDLGLSEAVQWIDGSFVEDVEHSEGRAPRDVDVLTIAAFPPISSLTAVQRALLDPREAKRRFRCDAYPLSLSAVRTTGVLIERVTYWHGLFSHRRDGVWKGIVALGLDGDDDARALARLESA
ncbi:MAG: hypothetical protein M3Y87_22020 [Myxococcota bacterium]|nr:hypothetical protein [Myxococcota bacterium]